MSKEAEEVCLLPFRLSHFAGGGSFVGVGVEDVEGEASDDGEVFRGVVLARAGVVFVEDDVEGPVQVVLDRPMRPDGVEELARAEAAREQEVAGRLGGGAVAGPARLDRPTATRPGKACVASSAVTGSTLARRRSCLPCRLSVVSWKGASSPALAKAASTAPWSGPRLPLRPRQ